MEAPSACSRPAPPDGGAPLPAGEETLALLRQIAQDTAAQKRHCRAAAFAARLQTACFALLLAGVIAAALALAPRVRATLNAVDTGLAQLNEVTATLNRVDFIAMGESVTALAVNGNESLSAAMEDLQLAMADVDKAVNTLTAIDMESLNTSIGSLSAILEPMARFFGKK